MRKNATPFAEGVLIILYCVINFPIYIFVLKLATSSEWSDVVQKVGVHPFLLINVVFAFVITGATFLGAILLLRYREKGLED